MKVLFLGYQDSPLIDFLQKEGEEVIVMQERIDSCFLKENQIEFIVSYGYRYIIKKDVIETLSNKIINLHISYLPWNKGADPNFWSFVENTPKGVTIHQIDAGLDTGKILLQSLVEFDHHETMRSSYQKLHNSIQDLFINNWDDLKNGDIPPIIQTEKGTYHRSKDKTDLLKNIENNWLDIPITELLNLLVR